MNELNDSLRKLGPLFSEGQSYNLLMGYLRNLLESRRVRLEKATDKDEMLRLQGSIKEIRGMLLIKESFKES